MGAALPAVTAASMVSSAAGSIAQGRATSASDKYNAQIAQNNAIIAQQNAAFEGEQGAANAGIEQQKTRAQVGDIKASQAANGINVNTGSAVDVRAGAAELGKLDAITIRSNAARAAYGYQTQAASDSAQAQLDRAKAKNASTAGYINAGTTLLNQGASAGQSGVFDKWLGSSSLNQETPIPIANANSTSGLM